MDVVTGERATVRAEVAEAVRQLFPAEVAEMIVEDAQFGLLVYWVSKARFVYGLRSMADVLASVDPAERERVGCAAEPAAFLAVKVREAPRPAPAPPEEVD